jgi:hypothetical protein
LFLAQIIDENVETIPEAATPRFHDVEEQGGRSVPGCVRPS